MGADVADPLRRAVAICPNFVGVIRLQFGKVIFIQYGVILQFLFEGRCRSVLRGALFHGEVLDPAYRPMVHADNQDVIRLAAQLTQGSAPVGFSQGVAIPVAAH